MRFQSDQVLAVLRAATQPLTTSEVTHRVTKAAGDVGPSAPWVQAMRILLTDMAQAGQVVGGSPADRRGTHGYLVPRYDSKSRYWATPQLAEEVRRQLHAEQVAASSAGHTAEGLSTWWHLLGGPRSRVTADPRPRVAVDRSHPGHVELVMRSTANQAAWLVEVLAATAADNEVGRYCGTDDPRHNGTHCPGRLSSCRVR